MAMASIAMSCAASSASAISSMCTSRTASSSRQSIVAQYVSCRTSGDGLIARDGMGSAAAVALREWSQKRVVLGHPGKSQQQVWRVNAGLKDTVLAESQWGPPINLGTAQLPEAIDLQKLQLLLFQWGNNLTQNANLPLPVPLKVDKIEDGVRLGYIRVVEGKLEDLVHIDILLTPASDEQPKAMFRAIRNGQYKDSVPPGEPDIMQRLLAALKISIPLACSSFDPLK